jgi:hypothetical protein
MLRACPVRTSAASASADPVRCILLCSSDGQDPADSSRAGSALAAEEKARALTALAPHFAAVACKHSVLDGICSKGCVVLIMRQQAERETAGVWVGVWQAGSFQSQLLFVRPLTKTPNL